ncbi:hypothetical protein [Kribbella sp. CA-247076]|uniref:hypothetical protein n=1 Tax=Kribbella sp. CA-247076 TaxID=3239941 RepID=UPI003D8DB7F5
MPHTGAGAESIRRPESHSGDDRVRKVPGPAGDRPAETRRATSAADDRRRPSGRCEHRLGPVGRPAEAGETSPAEAGTPAPEGQQWIGSG